MRSHLLFRLIGLAVITAMAAGCRSSSTVAREAQPPSEQLPTGMATTLASPSTETPTATAMPSPTANAEPTNTHTVAHAPSSTPTATATSAPSNTPRPTDVPTRPPTHTPAPTFTLSGTIFFDYNGNGVRDNGEPPIPGASVCVGGLNAVASGDGSYSVTGVPAGPQPVSISARGFRYVSLSSAAFQGVEQPVSVSIGGNLRRDWGLMQGFLTLPVKANVAYNIKNYVDAGDVYDHTYMQDWKGGTETYAGHQGVDFDISDHTVVAAVPGIVIAAQDDYETNPDLKGIGARVIVWYGNGYFTQYNDLKTLAVNRLALDQKLFRQNPRKYVANLQAPQAVQRGQVLGYTGYLGPPLDGIVHFENWTVDPAHTKGEPARIIDPFKLTSERGGVFANRLFSLWTSENTPMPSP